MTIGFITLYALDMEVRNDEESTRTRALGSAILSLGRLAQSCGTA